MSRICPETNRIVLYLECNECETKSCRNKNDNSDIKRDLYWKYLKELEEIKGNKWQESEDEQKTWCDDYIKKSYYIWTDIRFMDQIVGFLITGVRPDCHPSCDYFICQSYVLPEYRNKGLMTDAVNKFVKLHPGRYCMIILKNNNYAIKFWDNRFKDLGYSRIKLLDIGCLRKDEEQYGYEQQDKR